VIFSLEISEATRFFETSSVKSRSSPRIPFLLLNDRLEMVGLAIPKISRIYEMRKFCTVALMLLAATACRGEDLSGFGLAGLESVSDTEAMDVRGRGLESSLSSISTNSLAFSIVDIASGSVFNLNATSQVTGLDSVFSDMNDLTGGDQSLGLNSVGGVMLGDANFSIGDSFRFSLEGFSNAAQSSQIGGAATGIDFSALLP
jgi:hypothetical protein